MAATTQVLILAMKAMHTATLFPPSCSLLYYSLSLSLSPACSIRRHLPLFPSPSPPSIAKLLLAAASAEQQLRN